MSKQFLIIFAVLATVALAGPSNWQWNDYVKFSGGAAYGMYSGHVNGVSKADCYTQGWKLGESILDSTTLNRKRELWESIVLVPLKLVSVFKDAGYMSYYCIYLDPNWRTWVNLPEDRSVFMVKEFAMKVLGSEQSVQGITDWMDWVSFLFALFSAGSFIISSFLSFDTLDSFFFGKSLGYNAVYPILTGFKLFYNAV